ncbi:hypothetical protein [Streptomyces sp. SPB074]|uniref:hypothetical protein n=1 Tax=Streptomyces sp. (strain SPB074) TaxID=465543 RepID=UPI0001D1DCE2|nr:hypothetical protein [Streptomyces sp. SPB074]EFG65451.1 conserved hypothetical protein [Streptomyces sp. SPB074]
MHTWTAGSLSLDTLASLSRGRFPRAAARTPLVRLTVPSGMTTSMGVDAVGVPEALARRVMGRLPRMGCVFADGGRWWWIVPSGSDVALEWPAPAHYAAGALVPDARKEPRLVHQPSGKAPYTPPIPLYVTLCRLTDTLPPWSRSAPTED